MGYHNLKSKIKNQKSKIRILAPAKVNIGLLVKEKLPSGYHKIESILLPINLFDTIILTRCQNGIHLTTNICNLPTNSNNLAVKAAQLFFRKTRIQSGIKIDLRKKIPIGTGLGGGSSDAAATLLGLNRLFNNPLATTVLRQIASEIGMDVPFFLTQTSCYATGRGEILEPIKIPKLQIALYIPDFAISTRWAYQKIDETNLTEGDFSLKILCKKLKQNDLQNIGKYIVNTFERVVFPKYSDLPIMKTRLLAFGAYAVSLSGTGSAIFGLVEKDKVKSLRIKCRKVGIRLLFAETL